MSADKSDVISFNPAEQFERLVATVNAHPVAASAILIAFILWLLLRKDGAATKYLDYVKAKAEQDARLENRRFELIELMREREQPLLPGFRDDEEGKEQ
jgi:hypothetical protein